MSNEFDKLKRQAMASAVTGFVKIIVIAIFVVCFFNGVLI